MTIISFGEKKGACMTVSSVYFAMQNYMKYGKTFSNCKLFDKYVLFNREDLLRELERFNRRNLSIGVSRQGRKESADGS